MTKISRLSYDSDLFGYEIGEFSVERYDFDIEKFKREAESFRLVYIKSDIELKVERFKLVDKKITFSQLLPLKVRTITASNIHSFKKGVHDSDQIVKLAFESSKYSRFRTDENFVSNEYKKLYREWIINSVNGDLALDVLIKTRGNNLLGFTSLRKISRETAEIGLVAVDGREKGRGVGTELIYATLNRAEQLGFKAVKVRTQLDNEAAKKLYLKTNFQVDNTLNIYHYWNI